MALDRYTTAFLRLMEAAYPDLGGAVTDAREARRIYAQARFPTGPRLAAVTEHRVRPGLRVRVYRPHRTGALPVVVYLHGGGWVLCGLDTHDGVCRQLAERAGVLVVAVDYRLAPEHPFPAAPDDAYAATCWAYEHAPGLGGDRARLAVAGDSAGGALAAATCLRARDVGGPPLRFQVLVYPVTDCLAPRTRAVTDSLLTAAHMRWFTAQYLLDAADGLHPYASPLRAPDLSELPPALILTAEHDPLRDEGEAYADRLAAADVPVGVRRIDGLFHGLFGLGAYVPVARVAEDAAAAALRTALHGADARPGIPTQAPPPGLPGRAARPDVPGQAAPPGVPSQAPQASARLRLTAPSPAPHSGDAVASIDIGGNVHGAPASGPVRRHRPSDG